MLGACRPSRMLIHQTGCTLRIQSYLHPHWNVVDVSTVMQGSEHCAGGGSVLVVETAVGIASVVVVAPVVRVVVTTGVHVLPLPWPAQEPPSQHDGDAELPQKPKPGSTHPVSLGSLLRSSCCDAPRRRAAPFSIPSAAERRSNTDPRRWNL